MAAPGWAQSRSGATNCGSVKYPDLRGYATGAGHRELTQGSTTLIVPFSYGGTSGSINLDA